MVNVLCVIPARKGSKRLKSKNKLIFGCQPLYKWSLNAAKQIKYKKLICLSTDDREIIKETINQFDIYVHERDNQQSQDSSCIEDLCDLLIKLFNTEGKFFDFLIILQPTSPLRESGLINEYLDLVIKKNANGLVELEPIKISTGEIRKGIWVPSQKPETQSQMLTIKYIPSGRFYIYKINENKIIRENLIGIDIGDKCKNNIDTIEDFDAAIGNLSRLNSKFDFLIN